MTFDEGVASGGLVIWTVYNNPLDYPGKFVVRRYVAIPGDSIAAPAPEIVADTLEEARAVIPTEILFRMPRDPGDDHSSIVESWM